MKKSHESSHEFPEEQVRSAIQLGIKQAEAEQKSQSKNKPIKKKHAVIYTMASIAAAFIILIGFSYQSPALASSLSKIPIVGSVFGDSDLIGLQQAQEQGLTTQIGETKTINDISVTLDEVLYDHNNITIGLKIESEKELDDDYFGAGMDFTMDKKMPNGASGSYGEEIITSTSRTAIQTIAVTEDMPSKFDLGLLLQGANGEKWHFSTVVKKSDDIKQIPVQHKEAVDGIELDVKEVFYGESGVGVSFQSTENAKLVDDELDRAGEIEFKMEDQDGNEIKDHSGGVKGERVKDRMVYTSNKQFDPIDSDVKELTITPYLDLPTDGGGVEINEDGEERELTFEKDSLQPVEFDSFKVKITQ